MKIDLLFCGLNNNTLAFARHLSSAKFSVSATEFFSDRNLDEFDAVVLDCQGAVAGHRRLKDMHESSTVYEIETDREMGLLGYSHARGILIVLVGPPLTFPTPQQSAAPDYKQGLQVDIAKNVPVARGLAPFTDFIYYNATLGNQEIEPLMVVKKSREAVAGYLKEGDGVILFAPPLKSMQSASRDVASLEREARYVETLVTIGRQLVTEGEQAHEVAPLWAAEIHGPIEHRILDEIDDIHQQIDSLQTLLATEHDQLKLEQARKRLIYAQGSQLEVAVADALERLGFQVVRLTNNRADMLARHKDTLFVIEAKGVTKSAAENHARQLATWIKETEHALADDGTETPGELIDYMNAIRELEFTIPAGDSPPSVKGLLVLATFVDVPLPSRTEDDFPHAMRASLMREQICAISGLQLLCLTVIAEDDYNRRANIVQLLSSYSGWLEFGRDWQMHLLTVGPAPTESE